MGRGQKESAREFEQQPGLHGGIRTDKLLPRVFTPHGSLSYR